MKRKSQNQSNMNTGTWLTTYADLMNNLLVLFIMLYAMSIIDLQKFQEVSTVFSDTFGGGKTVTSEVVTTGDIPAYAPVDKTSEETPLPSVTEPSDPLVTTGVMDNLDEFVKRISGIIKDKGYEDQTIVERVEDYVYFRFRDGVLFYGDMATLKPDSYDILKVVADIINEAYDEIYRIEICGHTAWVAIDEIESNFNSWELSSDRALTVLKYFVTDCGIPKDKLAMSAYSSTDPYTPGTTEDEKALNRRVEIRLSRLIDNQ